MGRSTSSISIPLIGGPNSRPEDQPKITRPTADAVASASGQSPKLPAPTTIGLRYTNVPGQRGALVTGVQENSIAANSGLKTGDRIVAIDGRLLVSAEALQQSLGQRSDNKRIGIRMVRDGKLLSTNIDPAAKPTVTDSLATDINAPAPSAENRSVLGGVGALFGELLNPKRKSKPATGIASDDEMALGDDNEVQQVDFEADVKAKPKRQSNPLSLEELEPKPIGEEDSVELLPPQRTKQESPNKKVSC